MTCIIRYRNTRLIYAAFNSLVFLLLLLPRPMAAANDNPEQSVWFSDQPHLLVLGAGYAEIFDDKREFFGGIEMRPAFRYHNIGTWFYYGTGKDQSQYAAAGVLVDIRLGRHWILTPAFGAGYFREGEWVDLGFDMQFRSSIEFSRAFKNGHRIGIMLAHLSNGSFSDINPGTETLSVNWAIPLGRSSANDQVQRHL